AVGANAAGRMSDRDLGELEDRVCPGAGACGGQFTANTMAMALEFLGLSPMGTASVAATDPATDTVGLETGKLVMDVLRRGLRPRDADGPDLRRGGGARGRAGRAGGRPAPRAAAQADRRPRHPARQPRARRLRREDGRPRAAAAPGPRARLRP